MQLVLSWPVRILVIGLILFSLMVDGAGYIYRAVNHYPLRGAYPGGQAPDLFGWQVFIHRGLDLQGGSHLELRLRDIPPGHKLADVQSTAIAVISKRINALGVNEPLVQPEGSDRIIVELAGVSAAKAQAVIGKTARLEFVKWVADTKAPGTGQTDAGYRPEKTGLSGDQVASASASLDSQSAAWVVNLNLNQDGASRFAQLTSDAYNSCPSQGSPNYCATRRIAIFEDLTDDDIANWDTRAQQLALPVSAGGKLLTNPGIQNPITGGQAQISGSFDQTSSTDLSLQINSGALPATLEVLQVTDVGATLGQDSVKRSLVAGVIGLLIVVIFMIAYYRLPGLLASLALLFYAAISLAVFKAIPVTLTLAGLAGFILSVGMAVDANVLIFERFKEEMRAGRTVGAAVDASVRRAWPAIRDSNTSTLITCAVLAFAGAGPVKGFAITLMVGVLVSLLSSIVITHNFLAIVLNLGFRGSRVLGVERGRLA